MTVAFVFSPVSSARATQSGDHLLVGLVTQIFGWIVDFVPRGAMREGRVADFWGLDADDDGSLMQKNREYVQGKIKDSSVKQVRALL